MVIVGWVVALVWVLMVLGVGTWGRSHQLLPTKDEHSGGVSICIPARNEASNIAECVGGALGQGVNQVIVVDDGSTDGTGEIALQAGEGDPRLMVIPAADRPPGWSGKAWALTCARGQARGDWLVFIDADVFLKPQAVSSALAAAGEAAGISLFGTWRLLGFWERVLIPAVGWFIRGALNLKAANDPTSDVVFANGQFIAVRAGVYDGVGGHEPVRASVLDDVGLARVFKTAGHPMLLKWAPWAFEVRLYQSLRGIVAGYQKNLFEGMERRMGVGLAAIVGVLVFGVAPLFLAPLGGGWLLALVLQMVFRFRLEGHDGRSGWMAWTHPVANIGLGWILFRSVFGRQSTWKGRGFSQGEIDD